MDSSAPQFAQPEAGAINPAVPDFSSPDHAISSSYILRQCLPSLADFVTAARKRRARLASIVGERATGYVLDVGASESDLEPAQLNGLAPRKIGKSVLTALAISTKVFGPVRMQVSDASQGAA